MCWMIIVGKLVGVLVRLLNCLGGALARQCLYGASPLRELPHQFAQILDPPENVLCILPHG